MTRSNRSARAAGTRFESLVSAYLARVADVTSTYEALLASVERES